MRALCRPIVFAAALAVCAPAMAARDEPLPRFEDALCPGVAGLQTDAAEAIVARIRANAAELGRRLGDPDGCRPNIIVYFVADGRAFVQAMDRDEGYSFDEMDPAERRALLADPGPVHVVNRIVTRTRDGVPVYDERNLAAPPQANMWMAHSKIYTGTQRNIVHSLILIDRAAARGLTLDQIADYATLRAMVHNPPVPAAAAESVLGLFSGAATRPAALTSYDRALLAALYEGLPNLPGSVKIAAIEQATGRPFPRP